MSNSHPLDSMYQEILLEHSRDPHNFGSLDKPDITAEGYNPLCGDKVCIQLRLKADQTAEVVRFKGEACSICMASASMLTDEISGHAIPSILSQIEKFRGLMLGTVAPDAFEGDLASLSGVRNFPVRIKCALLPWTTLNEAIEEHFEKNPNKNLKKGASL